MIVRHPQPRVAHYHVSLGHRRVKVKSESQEGAIRQARIHFSKELPRLWDVIHETDSSKFVVDMDVS